MNGWETVTAILGVAAIVASTYASIWLNKHKSAQPVDEKVSERVIMLESSMKHHSQIITRVDSDLQESKRRHDSVVDGIYSAINDLRGMVIEILKKE